VACPSSEFEAVRGRKVSDDDLSFILTVLAFDSP
jgi:hypothetical protein